mgnify:CR=1 FL=1
MLLVTATDLEMQALTAACVPARLPEQRLICGVGPAEAAFRLGLFLAAARASGQLPDCVLNIGIAGALLAAAGLAVCGLLFKEQDNLTQNV